jgi:hypothetical protein
MLVGAAGSSYDVGHREFGKLGWRLVGGWMELGIKFA